MSSTRMPAWFTAAFLVAGSLSPVSLIAQSPLAGNLLVWLRADAGLEISNTNVVSWTNQVANGIVFSAPTTPARPVFATNVVNGPQFTSMVRNV